MRYIKINGCGAIRSDAIVAVKMVTYDGKPKVSVSYAFANGLLEYMVADCGTLAERDELARRIIDAIVSENNICSTPKMFTMDKCLTPTVLAHIEKVMVMDESPTLGRCGTCKHWRRYTDEFDIEYHGRHAGSCENDKFTPEHNGSIVPIDGLRYWESGFNTGERFGCVHWVKKGD